MRLSKGYLLGVGAAPVLSAGGSVLAQTGDGNTRTSPGTAPALGE